MADFVINPQVLEQAGSRVIAMILDNTNRGIDKNGRPFEPYSTKAFSMPLGHYYEIMTKRSLKDMEKESEYRIRRSKSSGKLWITIVNGYAYLKRNRFPTRDTNVNLQWRGMAGGMLSDLQIIAKNDNSITIGFRSPEMAALASYHVLTGASKSRVIRDFLGITDEQKTEISDMIRSEVKIEIEKILFT